MVKIKENIFYLVSNSNKKYVVDDFEEIRLIDFTEDFISEDYIGWLNNKSLMRYSENRHINHDYRSSLAFLNELVSSGHIFKAVCLYREKLYHVGNVVAYIDSNNSLAEISILIGDYNIKGIGTIAWCKLIDYIFTNTGTRKIEAGTMSKNIGMLKVFKKSGMCIEGKRSNHFEIDGGFTDLVHSGIEKTEWEKKQ